jgi:hypothetical protein
MKQISWLSYYQNVPMFLVLIDSILSRPENQISIERNSVEKPSVTNNAHFRLSVAYSISAIILKKEWLAHRTPTIDLSLSEMLLDDDLASITPVSALVSTQSSGSQQSTSFTFGSSGKGGAFTLNPPGGEEGANLA